MMKRAGPVRRSWRWWRPGERAGKLLLILLSVLVVEALGHAFPALSPDVVRTMQWHAAIHLGVSGTRRLEPGLGNVLKPGLHHVVRGHPDFTFRYDTIPLVGEPIGLRETVVPRQPAAAVLGDSFVEGFGVEASDVWVERMERETGRPMLNLGQSGFSTGEYRSMLERALRYVRPEVVVVCVFANDFEERLQGDAKGLVMEPGNSDWGVDGFGLAQVGTFLLRDSFVYRLLRAPDVLFREHWRTAQETKRTALRTERVWRREGALDLVFRVTVRDGPGLVLARPLADRDWSRATSLVVADLHAMALRTARSNVRFAVVYAPSKEEAYADWLSSRYGPVNVLASGAAALRDDCAREGTPFLDLTPALQDEARRGRQLYWREDGHWNPEGHRIVANAVASWLSLGDANKE
jgi:lysophospholipase L1-like esterase